MIIVGLTGGIGHGKTTFAHLLATQAVSSRHYETWELVAEVANSLRAQTQAPPAVSDIAAINHWLGNLPNIIAAHLHVTVGYENFQISEMKLAQHPEHYDKLLAYLHAEHDGIIEPLQEITTETKERFRPLLQWLGGYLVIACGNGVWYDEIIRRITHERSHRYEIVTIGGVRYPGDAERVRNAGGSIIEVLRPSAGQQDAKDLTERERSLITPDSIIMNDGTLEELAYTAQLAMHDLRLRELKKAYNIHDT